MLRFSNLTLVNEVASLNTQGPFTNGATLSEFYGTVRGTCQTACRQVHNGRSLPVRVNCAEGSLTARRLLAAGYLPDGA